MDWELNSLHEEIMSLEKQLSSSSLAWMARQGMSFRAEYWAGTEDGTAMLVTPLSGRVELLATAYSKKPLEAVHGTDIARLL